MGTAVVAHRNAAPILDPPEHNLDCVAVFVEVFAVAARSLAVAA